MQNSSTQLITPFGLWELEANGTVRHFEPELGEYARHPSDVIGRNFFEIVLSNGAQELRDQVQRFILGSAPVDSFDLSLQVGEGRVRIRVLLATTRATRSSMGKLVLLHIRRAEPSSHEAGVGRKIS